MTVWPCFPTCSPSKSYLFYWKIPQQCDARGMKCFSGFCLFKLTVKIMKKDSLPHLMCCSLINHLFFNETESCSFFFTLRTKSSTFMSCLCLKNVLMTYFEQMQLISWICVYVFCETSAVLKCNCTQQLFGSYSQIIILHSKHM